MTASRSRLTPRLLVDAREDTWIQECLHENGVTLRALACATPCRCRMAWPRQVGLCPMSRCLSRLERRTSGMVNPAAASIRKYSAAVR